VAGASGYTGALAAALLDRHPRFDLVGITSRSDVGTRLNDLYPHHRVPLTLEEFDAERHGQADAAIVAPVVHQRGGLVFCVYQTYCTQCG
jgi:N-acetyl-gamma-glutamyl-phosphate reductase